MSATFTDIKVSLENWEPTERTDAFDFNFTLSRAPDKFWQDEFKGNLANRVRVQYTATFKDDSLKLTIQSFLSKSILDTIEWCEKQANLAGAQHLAAEEDAARKQREQEAVKEAQTKQLDRQFQELKANFNKR